MYLAPLNYDRYFKKVFSDTTIAKRFLEDFFDKEIQSIELLSQQHKITDDARAVEFDFRCKIDDRFVIIDMQQWYKPDIVQRFYTYHCINTALQLEAMPLKSLLAKEEKSKKIKNYKELLPVITLIWMVEDTLNFKDDFVSFTMTPEIVLDFVKNNLIWQNTDIEEFRHQREIVLKQLNNKTRNLDFLQENKLIYVFQKNIVKNKKYLKYFSWFELAEKTLNKANQKAEFLKYADDEIMVKLMHRITKQTLTNDDILYIESVDTLLEEVRRYERGVYEDGKIEGREEGREEGRRIEYEKSRHEKLEKARAGILKGYLTEIIADLTGLTPDEIEKMKETLH